RNRSRPASGRNRCRPSAGLKFSADAARRISRSSTSNERSAPKARPRTISAAKRRPVTVQKPRPRTVSLRRPESAQRPAIRALAELLERALSYLPNSLARHAHQRADLFERHRLGALFETVIQIQDLALPRRQVFTEHTIDELAHQLVIGALLDLLTVHAGESFTECRGFSVGSVDRGIERDFRSEERRVGKELRC